MTDGVKLMKVKTIQHQPHRSAKWRDPFLFGFHPHLSAISFFCLIFLSSFFLFSVRPPSIGLQTLLPKKLKPAIKEGLGSPSGLALANSSF